MPTIKGTASVTDDHAILKQLRNTKFPKSFSTPIQLTRIHIPVMTQYIHDKITSILGFDDEIVQSTAVNLFLPQISEGVPCPVVDPRRAQLDLAGFLGLNEAAEFAEELWGLLIDAQGSSCGIPRKLLERKKEEMAKEEERITVKTSASASASGGRDGKRVVRPAEMDRLWVEATRRAEAARRALERSQGEEGVAVPVSPPREEENDKRSSSRSIDRKHKRNGSSSSMDGDDEADEPDKKRNADRVAPKRSERDSKKRRRRRSRSRSRSRERKRDRGRRDRCDSEERDGRRNGSPSGRDQHDRHRRRRRSRSRSRSREGGRRYRSRSRERKSGRRERDFNDNKKKRSDYHHHKKQEHVPKNEGYTSSPSHSSN